MAEELYAKKYFGLLREYFDHPSEHVLMACGDLGRELLKAGQRIEDLVQLHEEALRNLAQENPDSPLFESLRSSTLPLMEMIMSHGMYYRAQMEEMQRLSVTRDLVSRMMRDLVDTSGLSEINMHNAGQKLAANSMSETFEDAFETFAAMGLGTLKLAEVDEEKRRWIFTGLNLMEIDREAGQPTCNYVRGFLYSMVQQISGSDKIADAEVTCQSMDDATCSFIVQAFEPH